MKKKGKNEKSLKKRVMRVSFIALGASYLVVGILLRNNRKLGKKVTRLEGQLENQRDLIKGLQKTVERTAFSLGKLHNQKFG